MQRVRRYLWQIVCLAVLFLVLIPYVGDNDFWFHILIGEVITEQRIFPRVDIFSYTAAGHAWINHEWLTQISLYGTYKMLGFIGVSLLVALIGAIMAGMLWYEYRRLSWLSGLLVIASFMVLKPFFVPRPQIFAYPLLLLLVVVIMRLYRTKDMRLAWVFPGILFVWGNIHSSVLIGVGVLLVVTGWEILQRFSTRLPASVLSPDEFKRLATASFVAIAASLVNPFFYHTHLYVYESLSHVQAYHSLIETQPVFRSLSHTPILMMFALHLAFLVAFVVQCITSSSRTRVLEAMLFGLFFLPPFVSIKYVPFAWMGMLPLLLEQCRTRELKIPYSRSITLVLTVFAFLIAQPWMSIGSDPHREWPRSAVAFMDENALVGNMYNSYTWGGYLMWQSKQRPVFIYGGYIEFYGINYFDSLDFAEGKHVDELIQKYDFSIVIARPWEPLAFALSVKEDWKLVYWDNFGMIFVRDDGKNSDVLAKEGMQIKYINDAVDAMVRKYPVQELPQLEKNLKRVIQRNPDTVLARYRLGFLYQAAGACDLATEQYKAVISLDYKLGGAHGRLAECYVKLSMPDMAKKEQDLSRQYAKNQRWWKGRP